MNNQQ